MADHSNQHQDTNPHSYVADPKSYALSGKIMLTAIIILFAVVVIMVGLHVYARCYIMRVRRRQIRRARRRTHLVFYMENDNHNNMAPNPTHGLDADVIKALPTFTFEKEEKGLECAVCLSEFEEGEKGRGLPKCKHCFHVECIDMWFQSHSTCPLCRSTVDAGERREDVDGGDVGGNEVRVELGEFTQRQLGVVHELTQDVGVDRGEDTGVEGSVGQSSSFGERRKRDEMVGVSIEVPPRRSQSFCFGVGSSDESGPSRSPGFRSPTSRILSLKRILSRDKKSPLPSPSGASSYELDIESGRVDSSSQALTPR